MTAVTTGEGGRAADVQATFCATLVRCWAGLGLREAVIAPGSRSTPLALAFADDPDVRTHVVHDERVAAFVALGAGIASGVPAAVVCTSGTAATHFHAAVVEAGLSNVPMLVLTADRPPELHDVGAAQTIDQTRLFGAAARWFHDPGVADLAAADSWPALAEQAWSAATGVDRGPVHLNLPMREPLVGAVLAHPAASSPTSSTARLAALDDDTLAAVVARLDGRRGMIVAGGGVDEPAAVADLAAALAWPVLADPRSGCRHLDAAIGAFDAVLRAPAFAEAHRPEVVLRLGEPPASKVLAQFVAASAALQVQLDGSTRRFDPDHRVGLHLAAPVGRTCGALAAAVTATDADWLTEWRDAQRRAHEVIVDELSAAPLSEPGVARLLTSGALAAGAHLVVASSMPIRDVEWFGGTAEGVTVHANRGANGIDGVVSTAIGVALATGAPTTVLLGDVAFCHDASALTGLARRDVDLAIVVVDNDGGGIFSFLAQHEQVAADRFEQLFGTPHGTDVVALALAHGIAATTATTVEELAGALRGSGVRLVRVVSEREANVAQHRRLNDAVVRALS